MIGLFYFARKWKVCLASLSTSVAYYKYSRKERKSMKTDHRMSRYIVSLFTCYWTQTKQSTVFYLYSFHKRYKLWKFLEKPSEHFPVGCFNIIDEQRHLGPDYMVSFTPGGNFRPASETNPQKTKLSITWRGIPPGAQFSPGWKS